MSIFIWGYFGKEYDVGLFLMPTGYWKVIVTHKWHLEYSEMFTNIVSADIYARDAITWIDKPTILWKDVPTDDSPV